MSITDRVLGRDSPSAVRASTADVMHVLKNRRRRLVIEILAGEDGPVRIGDLAERVAARENDTTVSELDSRQRKRVYIGLYQHHLDKLADVDAVAPRSRSQPVRAGPDIGGFEKLRKTVERSTGGDDD